MKPPGLQPGDTVGVDVVGNTVRLVEPATGLIVGRLEPKLNQRDPYRPILADWMTSPKNSYFAKAIVNRVWSQLFGRGIVNPVDDMHDGNPASHPELLTTLTQQFKNNGYDLKHLLRAICNSEAYQRTSKPAAGNEDADPRLFSRAAVRPLHRPHHRLRPPPGLLNVLVRPLRVDVGAVAHRVARLGA